MITAEGIVYLLPNAFTIGFSSFLCWRVWRMERLKGRRALALTILCELVWLCGHIGKLMAQDLETKILWDNFEFFGTCGWPMSTLAFALSYAGARMPRAFWIALWILPAIIMAAAIVDPWTGYALHPNARIESAEPFDALLYDFHPVLSIMFLQLLLQVTLAGGLLIGKSFWLTTAQRVVSIVLSAGILVPVFMSFLVLAGVQFTDHRDTSHISFGVGNVLVFAALSLSGPQKARGFSTLFDNAGDSILILNGLLILDCNKKGLQTFRTTREQIIGKSILEFCTKPYGAPAADSFWRSSADGALSGAPLFFKYVFLRQTGEEFDAEISLTSIQFGGEALLQMYVRDVTEAQTAAEERDWLIRELEAKNGELERFTYTASHDLKSPLVTIKNFIGLLEKDLEAGDRAAVRDDVRRIAAAADKMRELLDDLLELSRLGQAVSPLRMQPMDPVLDEVLQLMDGAVKTRSAEIIRDRLPAVLADPQRIQVVWQNLIENALKYSTPGVPVIHIGAREQKEGVAFFVRDNGIGIDSRYHFRVFEQFHKLDPATEGSGIGLSLVQRIVEGHNGRVWVESEGPGRGSVFWFLLPAAPADRELRGQAGQPE